MCSPLLTIEQGSKNQESYLLGRLLSYTVVGFILGAFGAWLKFGHEVKALSFLGFAVFVVLVLFSRAQNWVLAKMQISSSLVGDLRSRSAFLKGLFSGLIPCHLLFFIYALAAATGNPIGGAILLFGHAIVSTPALLKGSYWLAKLAKKFGFSKKLIRMSISVILILNLMYFFSRLIETEEVSRQKILFCF